MNFARKKNVNFFVDILHTKKYDIAKKDRIFLW